MTYQLNLLCGCTIDYERGRMLDARGVTFCPLHATAPLLLEACKSACDFIEKMISTWDEFDDEYLGDEDRAMLDGLRAAIAAASPDSYQAEPEEHNGQHL